MILGPALHVALLAASVLTTATLAGYAWRRRTKQGVISFCGLMAGFTLYSVAQLVGLLTLHPVWRLLWENLQWTGMAVIPLFWLVFAMEYTGYDEMLNRRTLGALAGAPLVTILLTWTNPLHGLMWKENTIIVVSGLAILEQPFGPWAVAFTGIGYGMIAVGGFLLLRLVWLSDHLYTSQALLLIVGIAVPVLANVLTVVELTPIRDPPIDMSPYAFSITGVAFGYALFSHRLFELVPATHQLGRDVAIRDLKDGVIIVDINQQAIYINPAAAELLDRDPAEVLGEPVRSLVDDSKLDFDTEDALVELERPDGIFEVRTSPIRNRRDRPIGHTLVVQDITARKRREQRLARQRDELAQLEELNSIIRGVNRALISATSREEIANTVCDQLVESELYQSACMADVPTWDGDADRWTIAGGDGTAASLPAALRNTYLDLDDRPETSISTTAAGDQSESWTIVPLAYGRTVYGALGLYPGRGRTADAASISDRERDVLAELGELIGHAINAVENRRLLAAESVVELELRSTDGDGVLLQASADAGCRLHVDGLVPEAGHGHLAYVRVDAGSAEAAADTLSAISETQTRAVRDEEDQGLLEWVVSQNSLLGLLVERGAHVLRATADGDVARFEVEIASAADVRSLMDHVHQIFPNTVVDAKREHDRPIERPDGVPGDSIANLTDRQQETLEAAYRAGYFDWPRESTAEEIAETLDIASPTLHAHLRKAESSLFGELFNRELERPQGE